MLNFNPQIRIASYMDAEKFLQFLCKLDAQSPYMQYAPGERSMTVQGMRSRMKKQENQGNSFVVVVENLAGEIVGYFSVNAGNSQATRHSATVAVGVLESYRSEGLAQKMMGFAMAECLSRGVTRWECTVVCENVSAVRFYVKQGFDLIGKLYHRFLSLDGYALDELILERHI